jgi:predicted nucleic acid-binding Zn ribbon protein
MSDGRKRRPTPIGDVVTGWLGDSGLGARVDQAAIIPEWPSLVGRTIAAVTTPQSITSNGTLFVKVTTNAWITELSLLEPELMRSLNSKPGRNPIKRIRWLLK